MKSCLYLSGLNSYLLPTYLFFDKIIKGQKVFSYSKSCGKGKRLLTNSPDSSPSSIEKSKVLLSIIGSEPLYTLIL